MLNYILLLATTETESTIETVVDTVPHQLTLWEQLQNYSIAIWNNTDWSQFIPTMIATFIGFALAIWGSFLYDNYKDNSERKALISNLCNELEEMKNELSSISVSLKKADSITLWISPLKTYIWDSIAANNKLGLLSDKDWYKDLLFIYHTVHEYNTWHQLRTSSVINKHEYEVIEGSMLGISSVLELKINSILPRLTAQKGKR